MMSAAGASSPPFSADRAGDTRAAFGPSPIALTPAPANAATCTASPSAGTFTYACPPITLDPTDPANGDTTNPADATFRYDHAGTLVAKAVQE